MQERTMQERKEQFDGGSVRRILELAAEEQHRLDRTLADAYSLQELEEMAAEVRISPEALHAAIEVHRREATSRTETRDGVGGCPRGWLAVLEDRLPASWSPALRSAVLAGSGLMTLSGLLLSLTLIAPELFWMASLSLIFVSLLVLLGASPF